MIASVSLDKGAVALAHQFAPFLVVARTGKTGVTAPGTYATDMEVYRLQGMQVLGGTRYL
jgi:hypothetical protein